MKQEFISSTELSLGSGIELSEFKIEANANLFQILSDKIYSDKIGAVIREIASNAADAHIQVGNPRPFDIILPNNFNQSYIIRDYGPGLSDEDVKNVYIFYGKSTKTDTNSQIGCFGIGAKSPFAYTQSFSIISSHKGKKTTYSAFVDPENKMQLARIGEESISINETGIVISIPVEEKDFYLFKEKTSDILARFSPSPNVIGDSLFKFQKEESLFSTKDWEISLRGNNSSSLMYAIVGNLKYNISTRYDSSLFSKIETKNEEEFNNFSSFFRYFTRHLESHYPHISFGLKCDVGELDIAVSREELSYTNKTFQTIINKLYNFYINLQTELISHLSKYKNELHLFLQELTNIFNIFGIHRENSLFSSIIDQLIKEFPSIPEYFFDGKLSFNVDESFHYNFEFISSCLHRNYKTNQLQIDVEEIPYSRHYSRHFLETTLDIPMKQYFNGDFKVVFIDENITQSKIKKKLLSLANSKMNQFLIARRFEDKNKIEPVASFEKAYRDFEEYLKKISCGFEFEIIKSSSIILPKIEKERKIGYQRQIKQAIIQYNRFLSSVIHVDLKDLDDTPKVYLIEHYGQFLSNPTHQESKQISEIIYDEEFNHSIDNIIYIVKKKDVSKLNSSFVCYDDAYIDYIKSLFTREEFINYIEYFQFYKKIEKINSFNILFWYWIRTQNLYLKLQPEIINFCETIFVCLEVLFDTSLEKIEHEYNQQPQHNKHFYLSEIRRQFLLKNSKKYKLDRIGINKISAKFDIKKEEFSKDNLNVFNQFTERCKYFTVFDTYNRSEEDFREIFDIMLLKSEASKIKLGD